MGIPLHILTQSQRYWYAQMIVAAILADGEITQPETDFIKQILPLLKKPKERIELTNSIATKKSPPIFRPPGVPPKVLAAVFIEMALVMISDIDFADTEKDFLAEVARVFQFQDDYYKELVAWCEEGLNWKNKQLNFVSATKRTDLLQVPVSKLNPNQQRWYAETLISGIMSDQQLDMAEVKFLKMAINLIKDENQRKELTNLVRRNRTPSLSSPPSIPEQYLITIFIEVMLIISADESLDKKEHDYLKQLASLCEFSDNLFTRLIAWCVQGIKWKRAKNPLISRSRIRVGEKPKKYQIIKGEAKKIHQKYVIKNDQQKADEEINEKSSSPEEEPMNVPMEPHKENEAGADNSSRDESPPEMEQNPDNNSITDFNMSCFVCNSQLSVKFFELKEKSQKPKHNIFGIPIYKIAAEGFDPIDYNRCKVAICHTCYFASPQKEMFQLRTSDDPPKMLHSSEFKKKWNAMTKENKTFLEDCIEELPVLDRSFMAVTKSYRMAIKASSLLATFNHSNEMVWHSITLRLTLAQVMMENDKTKEAEALLKQIQARSTELFKTVKNRFITFRSGRLNLLIALFFGEMETADKYLSFFKKFKETKYNQLTKEDQVLFQRVFGEIKKIMEQPEAYLNISLNGFIMDRKDLGSS
ncbi:hypothetical protein KKA14_02335, partial [bacterium]|nr:hypothetical protein [bacterium]